VIQFAPIPGAAMRTRSPFGFQLIDDVTGDQPLGEIAAYLDMLVGATWVATDLRGVITSCAVLAYPGLGRQREIALQPPKSYRVRVDAALYRPFYRATSTGIVVSVPPYNDAEPIGTFVPTFGQLILLPSCPYPYPAHIPVLRGEVVDSLARPVADALVSDQLFGERTLTDERGAFSLPLRQLPPTTADTIMVSDQLGRVGSLSITLPGSLASGVLIPIA